MEIGETFEKVVKRVTFETSRLEVTDFELTLLKKKNCQVFQSILHDFEVSAESGALK